MAALRQGVIEPADLATLLAIAQGFEFVSGGRCWASWEELQQLTGLDEAQVRASAERLLEAQLVACGRDADCRRWWYWRLSPELFTDCRTTRQADARRWAEWRDALASGCRPDDEASGTRLRRLRELARHRERLEAELKMAAAAPVVEPAPVESSSRSPVAERERELVLVGAGGGGSGSAQVVAPVESSSRSPAAPAGQSQPRGRRRSAGGGGSGAGGGGPAGAPRRRQPSTIPSMALQGRVVSLKHTPEQLEAERQRQRQLDEARQARAAAKAAAA